MEPIQITAHLAAPVAYHPGEGLALDGPLLYAVLLESLGEAFFRAPDNDGILAQTRVPHPDMPLATHGEGDAWVYCCSYADPIDSHGTETGHWHKRFDDALAQRALESGALPADRRLRVDTASGQFKSYRQPVYLELVERLTWYASGDAAHVQRLLVEHIRHLGKRRHVGNGVVARWEVAPWGGRADRWCWADDARTVPARPLPLMWLPEWAGETAYCAVRPPSWLQAHHTWCAVARAQ